VYDLSHPATCKSNIGVMMYMTGVGKLLSKRHLKKMKNTSEPQNEFLVSIQFGKECTFYMK